MVCIKRYMLEMKRNESGNKGEDYPWKLTTRAKATPLEKWWLFRKVMLSNSETTYKSDGILTVPNCTQFPHNQFQPELIPTRINSNLINSNPNQFKPKPILTSSIPTWFFAQTLLLHESSLLNGWYFVPVSLLHGCHFCTERHFYTDVIFARVKLIFFF